MSYKVELTERARKDFSKLDKYTASLIFNWIQKNLEGCSNPRVHGKALAGNHAGEWRYRIGDYRLISVIEDDRMVILALSVGHRKEVYK